ncbi:MAG: DUF4375 domain-containing protein [Clostridia bacterium]|nr:DUF4375 domain-containing protein [Clostridia bacterium]
MLEEYHETKKLPYEIQIWNKFVDLVTSQNFIDLSEKQRMVSLVFWYDAEVNNGGHSGYFECNPGVKMEDLIRALNEVGASLFIPNVTHAFLHGKNDDYVEDDKTFGEFVPALTQLLQEYVAIHANDLGITLD